MVLPASLLAVRLTVLVPPMVGVPETSQLLFWSCASTSLSGSAGLFVRRMGRVPCRCNGKRTGLLCLPTSTLVFQVNWGAVGATAPVIVKV